MTRVLRLLALSMTQILVAAAAAAEPSPLMPPEPPVIEMPSSTRVTEPAPLGLDPLGREYSLQSNRSWKVGGEKPRITVTFPGSEGSSSAEGRQEFGTIWARDCQAGEQTVVFTRKYFLLGKPKNFHASFGATLPNAIKQTRVFINGIEAFSFTGNSHTINLTETEYVDLFRYGQNTIVIEVTKERKKGNTGLCRSGDTALGVSFKMKGDFSADLVPSQTAGAVETRVYQMAPDATRLRLHFANRFSRMQNLGPSAAYSARFNVLVSASNASIEFVLLSQNGDEIVECDSPGQFGHLTCQLELWRPGRTPGVKFGVTANLPANRPANYVGTVEVGTSLESVSDVNGGNNWDRVVAVMCGPAATDPRCTAP